MAIIPDNLTWTNIAGATGLTYFCLKSQLIITADGYLRNSRPSTGVS